MFVPAVGNRDSDDLRQTSSASFPPEFYVTLLRNAAITKAIGVDSGVCPRDLCVFDFSSYTWTGEIPRMFE